MLWIGTVTMPLQIGHGADMLIWSGVAERCWPHVGHANLMSAAFWPRGKTRCLGDKVIWIGIVIISLQWSTTVRLAQPAMARGLSKDPSKTWKTREQTREKIANPSKQGIGTFPIPK